MGHSRAAGRSGRSPRKERERAMALLLKRMVHTLVAARTWKGSGEKREAGVCGSEEEEGGGKGG